MQMNDDSLMTLYGLLAGKAVHQPTAVAYTTVPENVPEYLRQQLRWMRGTFVRTLWWWRYLPLTSAAFWMPIFEMATLAIGILLVPVLALNLHLLGDNGEFLLTAALVSILVNYVVALRYFVIRRSDEPLWYTIGIWLLAPIAGLWRLLVLRALITYALFTVWRVSSWGTRGAADGELDHAVGADTQKGVHAQASSEYRHVDHFTAGGTTRPVRRPRHARTRPAVDANIGGGRRSAGLRVGSRFR